MRDLRRRFSIGIALAGGKILRDGTREIIGKSKPETFILSNRQRDFLEIILEDNENDKTGTTLFGSERI